MHLVCVQRVVRLTRPVNQHEMPSWEDVSAHLHLKLVEIRSGEVIAYLREKDEIERSRWSVSGHLSLQNRDVLERGATLGGTPESLWRDIDGEEMIAPRGQGSSQDANGAADLQGISVSRTGEGPESRGILFRFVSTRFVIPGIRVIRVEGRKIFGIYRS